MPVQVAMKRDVKVNEKLVIATCNFYLNKTEFMKSEKIKAARVKSGLVENRMKLTSSK
jgi:hypothetical protein